MDLVLFGLYHQLYQKIAHQPTYSRNAVVLSSLLKNLQNGLGAVLSNRHRHDIKINPTTLTFIVVSNGQNPSLIWVDRTGIL